MERFGIQLETLEIQLGTPWAESEGFKIEFEASEMESESLGREFEGAETELEALGTEFEELGANWRASREDWSRSGGTRRVRADLSWEAPLARSWGEEEIWVAASRRGPV